MNHVYAARLLFLCAVQPGFRNPGTSLSFACSTTLRLNFLLRKFFMCVEKIAIASALEFFKNRGYRVHQVSASRAPEHAGCDLVIERNGERQTIEVKGTSNEWKIPDLYGSEVRNGMLTADQLLLVYVVNDQASTFCLIPRDEIKPDEFRERRGYRIVEAVKSSARLYRYVQPLMLSPIQENDA